MRQLSQCTKDSHRVCFVFCNYVALFCVLLFVGDFAIAQNFKEPEMVFVEGGTFEMGCSANYSSDCAPDEKPAHEVQLSGFYIAKYEVTQALWKQVMGNNPSRFQGDSLPVENVTWEEVQDFIQRLNDKTGKKYRLPTEAEWEYAARGGQKSQNSQYAGSSNPETVAWHSRNSAFNLHAVGKLQPNELGIYDMSGNVWEWCSDNYGAYNGKIQINPTGAKKSSSHVLRGGCYTTNERQCRVSVRKSINKGGKDGMSGFRLAMDDSRAAHAAQAAKEAELAEKARLEEEKKAEKERIEAEKKAEKERREAEQLEAAKKAEEARLEAERIKAEKKALKEQKANEAKQQRKEERRAMPSSTFFTFNAAVATTLQHSYGFKIGTVKRTGWYLSIMGHSHFKGAFTPMESDVYELTGKKKGTKLSCLIGLAIHPCNPLSIHIGVGASYRALTVETDKGWLFVPARSYIGVDAAFGFMFHIKKFAFSMEAVYTALSFTQLKDISIGSDITRLSRLEGKLGIGFMIPNKKKNN